MRFEWDGIKAASNLIKHGIAFSEVAAVFEDSQALYKDDAGHSGIEPRWLVIGRIPRGVVTAAFTWRGNRVRLISARRASRQERRLYAHAQRKTH